MDRKLGLSEGLQFTKKGAPRQRTSVNTSERQRRGGFPSPGLIPGRDNPSIFDHQNDRSFRSTSAVEHTFGNNKSLSWWQINGSALQINQEPAFDYIEKFVVIIMLVPMVFALDHADTDYRGVYLAERLIEPRFTGIGQRLFVNHLQSAV
jgi:hypothetical protein